MSHSIGFGDSKLKDELELASSGARRLGLLHREHIVSGLNFFLTRKNSLFSMMILLLTLRTYHYIR